MKLQHIAGEEIFVDFAGKKLHIIDKHTGELSLWKYLWPYFRAASTPISRHAGVRNAKI